MKKIVLMGMVGVVFAGCGGAGTSSGTSGNPAPLEAGPHGGVVVPLPDQKGLVEVSLEAAPGASKRSARHQLVARFLQPGLKLALDPPPDVVSVTLQFPDREAETMLLKPVAEASSSHDPGRFVSAPGDYAVDPLIGELKATFHGQVFAASFTNGR